LSSSDYTAADFLRFEVLDRQNRGDECRFALAALLKARSNDLEVRSQMGWFYLSRNDAISARKEFDFICSVEADHVLGINGLGAVYFYQGNLKKGAELFRKASKMEPHQPVLLTNLAWALIRQQEPKTAVPAGKLRELRKLVWERPSRADEKDDFSEAEKLCQDALALDPQTAEAYTCLGSIAFRRGRMLESEDFLRTSIRLNAKKGGYVDLGALYVHMGQYDEAERNLKIAVKASRTDSRARIELGNVYLLTSREKEGIRLFREAADIDPADPEPPRALALALQRQGDYREAEQVLRKAIQTLDEQRTWQLHLTLAQLLTELGEKNEDTALYDDALKEINTAIPLKPLNPDVRFQAGMVWHRLEDDRRAAKHFRESLRLDPNHIDAARNLRIVRALIRDQKRRGRGAFWLGLVLGLFCLLGTLGMWYLYFHTTDKITSSMIAGLTPAFIAVAAAAFLFPYLVRLKLPGMEADLSQPVEKISKGPVGGVGGSSAR
jgi:tetratricopeptide (TPR) repeat protein